MGDFQLSHSLAILRLTRSTIPTSDKRGSIFSRFRDIFARPSIILSAGVFHPGSSRSSETILLSAETSHCLGLCPVSLSSRPLYTLMESLRTGVRRKCLGIWLMSTYEDFDNPDILLWCQPLLHYAFSPDILSSRSIFISRYVCLLFRYR